MEDRKSGLQRRHFLLTLGAGGVAAAATVASVTGKPETLASTAAKAADAPASAQGVSEHARKYYRSAHI